MAATFLGTTGNWGIPQDESGIIITDLSFDYSNQEKVVLDKGGEIAGQLAALYDYIGDRLIFANLKNNPAALDEVLMLLGEIHSAWVEIGPEVGAEAAAA